jgi:hypothetical protein
MQKLKSSPLAKSISIIRKYSSFHFVSQIVIALAVSDDFGSGFYFIFPYPAVPMEGWLD